jgi:hypothetical protein
MRQKLILIASALLLLLMVATAGSRLAVVAHAEDDSEGTLGIEGGWLSIVTVPPGAPGPASFVALESFGAGGGWSGRASIGDPSGGFGTWRRTHKEIVVTHAGFSQDPSGNPTGTVFVHRQLHLTSPDTWEGTSTIAFCNLNGNNCFSPPGHAVISAMRIKATGPVQ